MRKLKLVFFAVALAALTPRLALALETEPHPTRSVEHFCSEETGKIEREGKMSEALAKHLKLNDAQKALLKDFEDARAHAFDAAKKRICGEKPDLSSFEARLNYHQRFLEDRLEMVKTENPKLIAFYNSLDAVQKAQFDKLRERHRR